MKKNFKSLWNKSLKVIPGGNGLLSKRPERFLPDGWPTYFSRSKDAYVWDLNNNKYDDLKSPAGKVDYHTMGACYEVLSVL